MNREPTRIIRPAGESDEYDSSDFEDGFDMPGLSSKKKRNRAKATHNHFLTANGVSATSPPTTSTGQIDWGTGNGDANKNDNQDEDDWGPSSDVLPLHQPQPISSSEAARIACTKGDVEKVKHKIFVTSCCKYE
jgi:hypothetical protein